VGNVDVGTMKLKWGDERKKSGQGETGTNWVTRLGIGRNQTAPQHRKGVKTTIASTLCFQVADKGRWPGCPSLTMVTHTGQESDQE